MRNTWFRRIKNACLYWFPLLVWMVLIYWLSDQPVLPHPGRRIGVSDHLGDYTAHAFIFGVLTFLAWRALRASSGLPAVLASRPAFIAGAFAALYAISDETHQYFVPGRWAKVADWFADLVGILIMTGILFWWQLRTVRGEKSEVTVRRAWE